MRPERRAAPAGAASSRAGGLFLSLLLLACADPAREGRLAYDEGRDGLDGADGPWGVSLWPDTGADPTTDLYRPVDADGAVPELGEAAPTVVLVQGGFVVPERYDWLAVHLASRGATVLVPQFGLDLALLSPDAAVRALDHAVADQEVPAAPAVIAGHSLGGVVSALQWAAEPRFAGVGLLASFPADDTPVEARADGTVLSLTGAADGRSALDEVQAGFARFAAPGALGVVAGMNHYDWTDDPTEGELAGDGASTRPVADVRRDAFRALDAWLDGCVTGADPTAWSALAGSAPDTLELSGEPCPE